MEQADVRKQITRKAPTWKDEANAKRRKEEQDKKREEKTLALQQASAASRARSRVTEI